MEVKLKVLVGSNAGQEIRVPAPKFLIGRAEDCHMRPKSDLISRHHCVLLTEEQVAVIRDLGSRNGTFVNDERIMGERELKAGDRLKIGPLEFEVGLVMSVGAKKRPRVTSIKEAATRTAAGVARDDVDVAEWLDNEQSPAESRESTETREIDSSDTEEISIRTTTYQVDPKPAAPPQAAPRPAAPSAPPATSPTSAAAPTETRAPTNAPKQPPKPKNSSGDSGKAAADVLRKFFQRR